MNERSVLVIGEPTGRAAEFQARMIERLREAGHLVVVTLHDAIPPDVDMRVDVDAAQGRVTIEPDGYTGGMTITATAGRAAFSDVAGFDIPRAARRRKAQWKTETSGRPKFVRH